MKWYIWLPILAASFLFGTFALDPFIKWIRAKIRARKIWRDMWRKEFERPEKKKDELQITVTADCSQAISEIERFGRTLEYYPVITYNYGEDEMPTRKEIEDALHGEKGCLAKWTFMPKVCNGAETHGYYTDLWCEKSGADESYTGCAYCKLFHNSKGCPLDKNCTIETTRGCIKEYRTWRDNPTHENALAMLDKVEHSLDNYFEDELPSREREEKEKQICACGKFKSYYVDSKTFERADSIPWVTVHGGGWRVNYCPYCGKKL